MNTAPCPCGGSTYVDDFAWPGRPLQFFLRCDRCWGMSDRVDTEDAARALVIRPDQVEPKCA